MKKTINIVFVFLTYWCAAQHVDVYAPGNFQEILEQDFSTAWTPSAMSTIDNLSYITLHESGTAAEALMLNANDRFSANVMSTDSINGISATYSSAFRSMFQLVDKNTNKSSALSGEYLIKPLLHSYYTLDYDDNLGEIIVSDAGSFYVEQATNSGYLIFEFVGSPSSVQIKASGKYYYNSSADSLEELTSWTDKWLKINGNKLTLDNSQSNATSFLISETSGLIDLSIPQGSDFNPLSTEWKDNPFAAYPNDVWDIDDSQFFNQFLMDVDTKYQSQFGNDPTANSAASQAIDEIETSLQALGESLRYDKSLYLSFRRALLDRVFSTTDIYNGVYGDQTVPYVYFTNATDDNGELHPFMVIASHDASSGLNLLIDVAKPPGEGNISYDSGAITRNAILEHKLVKIPLKDYGLVTNLTDNDLSAYGTLAEDLGLISNDFDVYNYASTASNGIAIDGVVIYPAYNNNLRFAAEDAEITVTGIHVGRGMGLHYHADGHSFSGNGINLYNLPDYAGKNHPPIIAFAYDGIALFGKYEASFSSMEGYNVPLDDFGGHDHGDLGYHYHCYTKSYYADSLGTQIGPFNQHFLLTGAWKGDVNDIPAINEGSTSQLKDPDIGRFAGASYTPAAIREEVFSNLLISPNPTSGKCSITINSDEIGELFLYDVHGKQLCQKYFLAEADINLNHYDAGIYILKVCFDKQVYHSQIVKH